MCQECRQSPCHSQCPNAPEPPSLFNCDDCNEGITDGEEYVNVDGSYYHLECLENKSTKELIELLGYGVEEAQFEDYEP